MELSFKNIFKAVKEYKFFISIFTISIFIVALVFSLFLPNIYSSKAILQANEEDENTSLQRISQLSALAGAAGISLPQTNDSKTLLGVEIMKSFNFFNSFADDEMLVEIFATKGWDYRNNKLIIKKSIYDSENENWIRNVSFPRTKKPSIQEAHDEFVENMFRVFVDKETNFVHVSVSHYSPYVAQKWVKKIVAEINSQYRDQEISKSNKTVEYLRKEYEQTNMAYLQDILSSLIENEYSKASIASASPNFLFTIIEPPIAEEFKSSPDRFAIILISTLIALMFSVLIAIIVFFNSRHEN